MAKKPRIPNLLDDVVERLPMDAASRLKRADDLGFHPHQFYHATTQDIKAFDPRFSGASGTIGGKERAVFLVDKPAVADSYLPGHAVDRRSPAIIEAGSADMGNNVGRWYGTGSNVMPVRVRNVDDFAHWDMGGGSYSPAQMEDILKQARKDGAPGVIFNKLRDPGYYPYNGPIGNPREKANVLAVFDPSLIRSNFAAFDPAKIKSRDILAGGAGLAGTAGLLMPSEAEAAPQAPAPQASQGTLGKLYDAVTTNPIGTFKAFGSAIGDSVKDYARSVYDQPSKGAADALELGVTSLGGLVPQAIWAAMSPTEANAGEQAILDERIRRIAAQQGLLAD